MLLDGSISCLIWSAIMSEGHHHKLITFHGGQSMMNTVAQ